jgi:hypothetical protein
LINDSDKPTSERIKSYALDVTSSVKYTLIKTSPSSLLLIFLPFSLIIIFDNPIKSSSDNEVSFVSISK